MIIQNRRQIPTVSVTGKPGHRQLRIAFNAALVRAAKLDGFEFMAVESGAARWHLSITHDAGVAAAVVILEGQGRS